ncbi:hypothetical protein DRQ21_04795 [Candidatus Fermentibacteria bacterium]|nr:MAG: hypothetical protein DRQ21_04795 [Candidatus Fermentibacteria bacterium]
MNTKALLILLVSALILPWVVLLLTQNGVVGMYLQRPHTLIEKESDVYDCIWHFWWVKTAVNNGEDPRVYGEETLAWHNVGWPDQLFAYISGAGYNSMLFVASLFTGIAGYFLARSWKAGKNGALLAGFIMVWMPVHVVRMYQHYPIASIGFVLMVFFFAKKWITTGDRKNLVFITVFSILAVMESLYFGLVVASGWLITSFLSGKKYLKRSSVAGIAAGAGCIIGSLWLLTSPGAFDQSPEKDWKEAVYWAAEPQSFVLPSFLGQPLTTDYMPSPFEGVVSPGSVVALLALLYCWRKKSWKALVAVLGVIVLAWGPLLKFNGVPTPVPLPYMVLVKLPFLSAARAPSRLAILTGIMAAIAAGVFVENRKPVVGWLLAGLILVEITPLKLETIEASVPQFYSTYTPSGFTLEIPSSDRFRRYSLFETVDGAPRLVKYLARGGEVQMQRIPVSLRWESCDMPDETDLISTGAGTVVYNRWMFTDSIRLHYDSLYSGIFPEHSTSDTDSVWAWISP